MASGARPFLCSSRLGGEKRMASEDETASKVFDEPELCLGSYTVLKALLRRSVAEPLWRRHAATSPATLSKLLAFGASVLQALACSHEEMQQRRRRAAREKPSDRPDASRASLDIDSSDASLHADERRFSRDKGPLLAAGDSPLSPLALLGELAVLLRILRNLCVEGQETQNLLLSLGGADLFLSNTHVLVEALAHFPPSCRCSSSEGGWRDSAVDAAASVQSTSELDQGRQKTSRSSPQVNKSGCEDKAKKEGRADTPSDLNLESEQDAKGVAASLLQFLSNLSAGNDRARVYVQQRLLYVPLLLLALASPSVAPAFMLLNTLFKGEASSEERSLSTHKSRLSLDTESASVSPDGAGAASSGAERLREAGGESDKAEKSAHTDPPRCMYTQKHSCESGGESDRFFELLAALYIIAANEDTAYVASLHATETSSGERNIEVDDRKETKRDSRTTSAHAEEAAVQRPATHLEWPLLFILQLLNRESDGSFFFRFLESLQLSFSTDTMERFAVLLLAPPSLAEQNAGKAAVAKCKQLLEFEEEAGTRISQEAAEERTKNETPEEKYDEIQAFCDRPCRAVYVQQAVRQKLSGVGQSGLFQFLLVLFEALLDDTDKGQTDFKPGGGEASDAETPTTLRMKLSKSPAFYGFVSGQLRRAFEGGERLREFGLLQRNKWVRDRAAETEALPDSLRHGREAEKRPTADAEGDASGSGASPATRPASSPGSAGAESFAEFFFSSLLRSMDTAAAYGGVETHQLPRRNVCLSTGDSVSRLAQTTEETGEMGQLARCTDALARRSDLEKGTCEDTWNEAFCPSGPPFDILLFASQVKHYLSSFEPLRGKREFADTEHRTSEGPAAKCLRPHDARGNAPTKNEKIQILPPSPSTRAAKKAEDAEGVTVIEGSRSAKDLFLSACSLPASVRVVDAFRVLEDILLDVSVARAEALEAWKQRERSRKDAGNAREGRLGFSVREQEGTHDENREPAEARIERRCEQDTSVQKQIESSVENLLLLLRFTQQQRLLAFLYCSDKTTQEKALKTASETRGQDTRATKNNCTSASGEHPEVNAEEIPVQPHAGDLLIWGLLQRSVKSGLLIRALANLLVDSPRSQQIALHAQALPLLASFAHTNEDDPFTRESAVFALRVLSDGQDHKNKQATCSQATGNQT
ncbi:hypothetical protein TGVAND_218950 [Toxoplasma gondii VAND]|uniref:Uncharacterized protein n=1 Tax=Toxoplasma gondii VAND TaxID=933077 RepID=A0A086PXT4_TOXGO|nr:hypothetical protein TGVAND_218950 [Toxoplasma gondii VAND]